MKVSQNQWRKRDWLVIDTGNYNKHLKKIKSFLYVLIHVDFIPEALTFKCKIWIYRNSKLKTGDLSSWNMRVLSVHNSNEGKHPKQKTTQEKK